MNTVLSLSSLLSQIPEVCQDETTWGYVLSRIGDVRLVESPTARVAICETPAAHYLLRCYLDATMPEVAVRIFTLGFMHQLCGAETLDEAAAYFTLHPNQHEDTK
jgi:hypothetical protein